MRLIDADALTEEIEGMSITVSGGDVFSLAAKASVVDHIWFQPAIDAVPVVHGRWEKIPLNAPDDRYGTNKHNMRIKCTACGFVTSSDFIGFRYCHCCGAKMDAQEHPHG